MPLLLHSPRGALLAVLLVVRCREAAAATRRPLPTHTPQRSRPLALLAAQQLFFRLLRVICRPPPSHTLPRAVPSHTPPAALSPARQALWAAPHPHRVAGYWNPHAADPEPFSAPRRQLQNHEVLPVCPVWCMKGGEITASTATQDINEYCRKSKSGAGRAH